MRCQEHRSLELNRKTAQRLLALKLDQHVNKERSLLDKKVAKLRKQKAKAKSRAKRKYGDVPTDLPTAPASAQYLDDIVDREDDDSDLDDSNQR